MGNQTAAAGLKNRLGWRWASLRRGLRGLALHVALVSAVLLGAWALGGTLTGARPVAAASAASDQGLMVAPVLPSDNHVGKAAGYFDLTLPTTEAREITVTTYNASEKPITVAIAVLNATTKTNGQVVYEAEESPASQLVMPSAGSFIKAPKSVRLAAGQQKNVAITVAASKTAPAGYYLGALRFSALVPATGQRDVRKELAYTIAVALRRGKQVSGLASLAVTQPTLRATTKGVVFEATITNAARALLKDATATITLTNAESSFLSQSFRQPLSRIAPQTEFSLTHLFQGQKLVAGAYRMTTTFTLAGKSTTRVQYLHVAQSGAVQASSKQAFNRAKDRWRYVKSGGIGLVILVLGLLVWRGWRRHSRMKGGDAIEPTDR
ncbi:WxL protein peptidoglycan domain-containing protein [Lacticaseibacillus mingshuiensis]|uniref:WxL protein peptidoglycan domain-containing protein n=1 Tax=Lacticaseibacillus mingshuiensis TaxID=2799574 RepID=A0ABW4CEK6_9LACO|nr:DUF916 domain-containing protein [Lacticaseibacillus mingshuiensis]